MERAKWERNLLFVASFFVRLCEVVQKTCKTCRDGLGREVALSETELMHLTSPIDAVYVTNIALCSTLRYMVLSGRFFIVKKNEMGGACGTMVERCLQRFGGGT